MVSSPHDSSFFGGATFLFADSKQTQILGESGPSETSSSQPEARKNPPYAGVAARSILFLDRRSREENGIEEFQTALGDGFARE
jgi:hypothetical protein